MNRRVTALFAMLFLAALAWGQGAFAAKEPDPIMFTLKGLKGVQVWVGSISRAGVDAGLSRVQIQKEMEMKLEAARIKVYSQDERMKDPGRPYMLLCISVTKNDGGEYSYFVEAKLNQRVRLERDTKRKANAVTWSRSSIHVSRRELVRDFVMKSLNEKLDKFIDDYHLTNMKI